MLNEWMEDRARRNILAATYLVLCLWTNFSVNELVIVVHPQRGQSLGKVAVASGSINSCLRKCECKRPLTDLRLVEQCMLMLYPVLLPHGCGLNIDLSDARGAFTDLMSHADLSIGLSIKLNPCALRRCTSAATRKSCRRPQRDTWPQSAETMGPAAFIGLEFAALHAGVWE